MWCDKTTEMLAIKLPVGQIPAAHRKQLLIRSVRGAGKPCARVPHAGGHLAREVVRNPQCD